VRASTQTSSKRLLTSPLVIAAIALALRLAVLYVSWHRASPAEATGPYGFETGWIAASIAAGKGFSSPLPSLETGPTAWLSPIFPYIVAGIFKVWGTFSFKSHVAIQTLDCLLSALTILPIYATAKRTFSAGVAILSSWLWVILPSAWHAPIADIWDTSLTALCFALLFWATVALRKEVKSTRWATYGALFAAGVLINASLLAVLPFYLLWLAWQAREQYLPWLRLTTVTLLIFVLGIAPWTVRNYLALGKFIPVRSNFDVELWLGNNPSASDWRSFNSHPSVDRSEAAEYVRLGEIAYVQSKGRIAWGFIRSHPTTTLRSILRRAVSYWLSVSDRPGETWSGEPAYLKMLLLMNTAMILFSWLGLAAAWRERNQFALLYFLALIFYPVIFYVTHPLARYRFPLEPILVILALHGLTRAFSFVVVRQRVGQGANAVAR
jgi:hypothetical protein